MRATTRRRIVAGIALVVVAGAGVALAARGGGGSSSAATSTQTSVPSTTRPATTPQAPRRMRLTVRRVGRLPVALQDAAVTGTGATALAVGGLTAGSTSSGAVTAITPAGAHAVGTLPLPIHDAAAAFAGGRVYVMGGGQLTSEPGIAVVSPASGRVRLVGRFPTPLSDLAAATIGSTIYVVGGYTGTAWSNRIYAVRDGTPHAVATLPVGVRYAAVSPVGGSVIIAGGRTQSGPSRAVYRYTPGTRRAVRIGTLPTALMHASAGTIGSTAYVIGGLGSDGRPTRAVLAIDAHGHVHRAATLPQPLSDAGVAATGGRLLVVGGSTGASPTPAILSVGFTPVRRHRPRKTPPGNASAKVPSMYRGPLPGDLLIADRGNNRLLVVNPAGKILWRYPRRPGQPRLNFDDDAFFTPGGHAIISNEEDNNDIVRISYPSGHLVWRYGHPGVPGSGRGYLDTPDDAYLLRNGMVITSDDRNCRIVEIRNRRVVRSIGTPGSCVHDPPHSLALPNGDTPLPNGNLLISEINGSWIDEVTLSGKLVRSWQAPVGYPSDPQLTQHGNVLVSDYSRPGGVVILARRTGRLLWRYGPTSGPGELDHPSLAAMLPNGDIIIGDDYNHRIVIVDPHTKKIVWHYGHRGVSGTAPGYLNTPDGFDFIPVTSSGAANPAAIRHGP